MVERMAACRQTWYWKSSWKSYIQIHGQQEDRDTGTGLDFWKPKAHTPCDTFLPSPHLLIPLPDNKAFKYMGLWGPFWLKPPQGTSWKREQKHCKSQRTRKVDVRLCFLEMTGKLHPATCLKKTWSAAVDMLRWEGGSQVTLPVDKELQATTGMLRAGGTLFFKEKPPKWLSNTKWPAVTSCTFK